LVDVPQAQLVYPELVQLLTQTPVAAVLSEQEVVPEQNAIVVAPQAQLLSKLFEHPSIQFPVAAE
jgi:hypothetical protein